jgi:hypothetical protein
VELEASGRMAFVSADSMTGVTSCFRGGLLTLSRRLNETGKLQNYYKRKFIAKGKNLLEFHWKIQLAITNFLDKFGRQPGVTSHIVSFSPCHTPARG